MTPIKRKPIEIMIGWKAYYGWQNYYANSQPTNAGVWIASDAPDTKPACIVSVDLGWRAEEVISRVGRENEIPFNKYHVVDHRLASHVDRTLRQAGIYSPVWNDDIFR